MGKLYKFLVPIIVCFITISSVYMGKSGNVVMLVGFGLLLAASVFPSLPLNLLIFPQLLLLMGFHWFSEMNWCFALYLFLLIRVLNLTEQKYRSLAITLAIVGIYSLIRLSYSEINVYALLITLNDLISSILVYAMMRYIVVSEKEKRDLREKLLRYDALTGLMNYHEFRKQIDLLSARGKKICLVIADIYEMRALNIERGHEQVNQLLITIASQLQSYFPQALLSRYSGGEFAIAFEYESEGEARTRIDTVLSMRIPQATGNSFIYGSSFSEGKNALECISDAENELYSKKRGQWLRREEQYFRADKLKSVGELAAGMAHEIRNPLTTIKGFLQLVEKNPPMLERYYGIIMDEITRVSELTAEFLQFSKPNITKLSVVTLQSCVDRALSITQTEAFRFGHTIEVMNSEIPLYIEVERDKLVQVLINLIKNALDAMEEMGSITLRMTSKENMAVLSISDTGHGMTPETIERLFDPFFTTKENGTGLGLPISHKIIQDHGGRVDVQSEIGKGSTFVISLPLTVR